MDQSTVADVFRESISVAIRLGAPMLLLSMVVGVITAIIQAVTQIHEQTVSFVVKLIVVVLVLVIGGNWMLSTLQEFTYSLIDIMKQ